VVNGGGWRAEFYDFAVEPACLDGELAGLGDVYVRAAGNGARSGTPVIVASGCVDARLNLFFRTGVMSAARPSTWRRYAHALVVWLEFLAVFGRSWDEATPGDVDAFRDWRLTDRRNDRRVAPTTFDTDRAALNSFYGWAAARYGVVNPVSGVARGLARRRADGDQGPGRGARDGLRPASSARRQVKCRPGRPWRTPPPATPAGTGHHPPPAFRLISCGASLTRSPTPRFSKATFLGAWLHDANLVKTDLRGSWLLGQKPSWNAVGEHSFTTVRAEGLTAIQIGNSIIDSQTRISDELRAHVQELKAWWSAGYPADSRPVWLDYRD